MFKKGDVVYFKQAKKTTRVSGAVAKVGVFKGFGFGVFLGHRLPERPDVSQLELFQLLGQAGIVTIDDIERFLGKEAQTLFVEKFIDTYYGKIVDGLDVAPEGPLPESKLRLVRPDGKPVN